jgi:tetratricopeptide (TPR) repeat protein
MSEVILISLQDLEGRRRASDTKTQALAFDDESLESILYGAKQPGPTPASLYSQGLEFTRRFVSAHHHGNVERMTAAAKDFAGEKIPLSIGCCHDLSQAFWILVPHHPCPVIEIDLLPFGPLLEEVWAVAQHAKDKGLQLSAGDSLYHWYEQHGRYEEARRILARLIEMARNDADRNNEALNLNNFAFEYLLEKKWEEAAPLFEKAAEIFKEVRQDYQHANSRCNYWICRFECCGLPQMEEAEEELQAHAKTLASSNSWHSRKPFILLAKLNESRDNIEKAIALTRKAIRASRSSKTRYTEEDTEYIERLKKNDG